MATFPATVEGFDLIGGGSDLAGKGFCYSAAGLWAIGHTGNGALNLSNATDHISFNVNLQQYQLVSFWFKAAVLKTQKIMRICDEIDDILGETLVHAVLQLTSSGYLKVFKEDAVNGETSNQQVIYPNEWHHIELQLHLSYHGSFTLIVDGVVVALSADINLKTGNAPIYGTTVFRGQSNTVFTFDDIVIGTSNDALPTFLGRHEIITLLPDADDDMGNWTGSFADVNDPFGANDGDSTYISSLSSGFDAIFSMEDLPITANVILLVSQLAEGRILPTATYDWGDDVILGINPGTGQPWTRAEINALKSQLVYLGGGSEVRFTRTAFEVLVVPDAAGEARVTRMGLEVLASVTTQSYNPCIGGTDPDPDINTTLCVLPEYNDWLIPLEDRFIHYVFEAVVPAKEVIEWKTNVEISQDGTEVTTSLRGVPRTSMTYNIPESISRTADAFIDQYIAITDNWIVPLWTETQVVDDVVDAATVIPAVTNVYSFREGGYAVLYESPTKYQVLEVLTVDGSSLTLDSPVDGAYTAPRLMPARIGTITGKISKAHSGYNAMGSITFGLKDMLAVTSVVPLQYNGDDIYYDENLLPQLSGKGETIYTRRDKLDFELNKFDHATPWKYNRIARRCSQYVQGAQAILDFRGFLERRAGRKTRFWRPSFIRDMKVKSTGPLFNTLLVEAIGQKDWTTTRDHVAILDKDGNWYPRIILSYIQIDVSTMQLTFDDAPLGIDAADIDMVSFLGLYRFDSDSITLNWVGNTSIRWNEKIIEVAP